MHTGSIKSWFIHTRWSNELHAIGTSGASELISGAPCACRHTVCLACDGTAFGWGWAQAGQLGTITAETVQAAKVTRSAGWQHIDSSPVCTVQGACHAVKTACGSSAVILSQQHDMASAHGVDWTCMCGTFRLQQLSTSVCRIAKCADDAACGRLQVYVHEEHGVCVLKPARFVFRAHDAASDAVGLLVRTEGAAKRGMIDAVWAAHWTTAMLLKPTS